MGGVGRGGIQEFSFGMNQPSPKLLALELIPILMDSYQDSTPVLKPITFGWGVEVGIIRKSTHTMEIELKQSSFPIKFILLYIFLTLPQIIYWFCQTL